jgi:hypothetical protein
MSADFYGSLSVERRLRMFENRVRRKILGPERDELTVEWRRLYIEELYDLYSPSIIRVTKYRRMSWAEHVALTVAGEVQPGFWWGNLRERGHVEDLGVDGKKILIFMFKNSEREAWDSIWLRIGTGGGHL